MKYWNRSTSVLLLSFCCCYVNSSELSQLFTALSSDEFTKQQQNENRKRLESSFLYFTGMMITANDCYCSAYQLSKEHSTITVFHLNDDYNKTLSSFNLLGPLNSIAAPACNSFECFFIFGLHTSICWTSQPRIQYCGTYDFLYQNL